MDNKQITIVLTLDEAVVLSDWLERVQMTDLSCLSGGGAASSPTL